MLVSENQFYRLSTFWADPFRYFLKIKTSEFLKGALESCFKSMEDLKKKLLLKYLSILSACKI